MALLRPAVVCALLIGLPVAPAAAQELTGAAQLRRAYDAIFDARFEDVPQLLARTCPPAPAEACQLLDAVSAWWQIQLDPASVAHDSQFQSRVDAAIDSAEAWTRREPQRAEAWFYLGGAYGARAQWRVLRRERVGAARDGKRIKEALERALALDPRLQEAYFGIGLYHYYADVAPGGRQDVAVAAAVTRRRQDRGDAGDDAGARARRVVPRRGRLSTSRDRSLV
jgi:hypothetical protein